jgi:hypothetical protein
VPFAVLIGAAAALWASAVRLELGDAVSAPSTNPAPVPSP